MTSLTLKQIGKKIKKLEKKYESTSNAAILSKRKIEKQVRKWITMEHNLTKKERIKGAKQT